MVVLVGGRLPRGDPSAAGSSGPAGRYTCADSNSAHAGAAVGGVVVRGVEQPGQEQRAHHAQVLAQRVLDPQRLDVGEPQAPQCLAAR